MRVSNTIRLQGYFWFPADPGRRLPGTLTISDGGVVELALIELPNSVSEAWKSIFRNEDRTDLSRIVGHVEKYGHVTLDDCFFTRSPGFSAGLLKFFIRAHRAFLGVAYEQGEDVLLNTFRFSVEGLDEWLGISGITVESDFKSRSASVHYTLPPTMSFALQNGMQLQVIFVWCPPGAPVIREASISQKVYFKLVSSQSRPLEDYVAVAHKLTTFLCFAADSTVCIDEILVTSDAVRLDFGNGKSTPHAICLYYESLPFDTKAPKLDAYRMLFRPEKYEDKLEIFIRNWIDAYDNVGPALSLFFSARTGMYRYVDGRFLALIRAVETYHRKISTETLMDGDEFETLRSRLIQECPEERRGWLEQRLVHGNEVSLATRIKRMFEPFKTSIGTAAERTSLIRSIVDTRNFLTHFDDSSGRTPKSGSDMWMMCQTLEGVMQLHLLRVLGLSDEETMTILDENVQLRRKLQGD